MASSSNKPPVSKFMPSGYDYEFVDEVPEQYNCRICFYPMWRPVQTKCGHRFCKGCLQEANKRKNPPQCPEDRQELRKQCSDGCQWLGELGDLKDHTCAPATRELTSGQKVKKDKTPRKDMDKQLANSIGQHFNITSERLALLENENLKLKTSLMEVEQQFQNLKTRFFKEKDEREAITKDLTSLKTEIEQKLVTLDKNLQILNSQKGEFSKEINDLRKQIKQKIDEQTKIHPKTAVNTATINKDLAGKIERSRFRLETSIDELKHDFDKKMKETILQLQRDLDEQTRRIRYQMLRNDFENADTGKTTNKLIEQNDVKTTVLIILFIALFFIIKNYKKQLAALLLEI